MSNGRLLIMTVKERMPPMATAKFVSLNITPAARESVRRMAVLVTAETERRVTHSDALRIAEALMRLHRAEIKDLAETTGEDTKS